MMQEESITFKYPFKFVEDKKQQHDQKEYCAIIGKKGVGKLLYYQPLTKQIKQNNVKMFHPHDWSIENFEIGRRLGRGKYGYVYLVRQKQTKMILAIKILQKSKILKQEVMQQVRRELQIHSHLNHSNLLKMYGFFFDDERIYIMLQYATKGDLFNKLRSNKRFDQKIVKIYMKQMTEAIHYLQTLKIIHRDIKPENILVSSNNTLKLSDFGWSIKTQSIQRRTFCGTLDYFCPELVKYRPFDYKVDNWSLGILAYQLLCGSPPFYSRQRNQMFKNILNSEIKFPSFASELFKDFVVKLTMKNPSQRMELSEALKHPWFVETMDIQSNFKDIPQRR